MSTAVRREVEESFEGYVADQLSERSEELARRWMERAATEVHARTDAIPPDDLLARLSGALRETAEFVRRDEPRTFAAATAPREAVGELTRLRRAQGCGPEMLLRELDVLARLLDGACLEWLRTYPGTAAPDAAIRAAGRLNRAPLLMGEISTRAYHAPGEDHGSAPVSPPLRDFADMLVHELSTPLDAAESAALLLEGEEIVTNAQERRRFTWLIQRNLRRARTVLRDVRDLAVAEAAHDEAVRWLPLGQVLGEVLVQTRDLLREAGLRIEVTESIPDVVVDAARVELILLNLVSNAAKYSDPARPVRWVRLHFARDEGGGCTLSVSDNGLGIAARHQKDLFRRFFRAHPERAEGTGLGLAIVAEAVRQLRGRIEVESEPGVGSTFRVFLPAAEAQARSANGASAPVAEMV